MLPVDDVLLIGECVSDKRKKLQREHLRTGQPVLRISFFPRGLSVSTLESVIERIQRASFFLRSRSRIKEHAFKLLQRFNKLFNKMFSCQAPSPDFDVESQSKSMDIGLVGVR